MLSKVLSTPSIVLILLLASAPVSVPLSWSYGQSLESNLFPVVSQAQISNETVTNNGVSFYARFEKLRQCEFLGLSWYSKDNQRLVINFDPKAEDLPVSRPTGDQFAGPWELEGVSTTEETRAVTHHQCHPLWVTKTEFKG